MGNPSESEVASTCVLFKDCRAVDCQLYVSAVSPARNPKSSYQAWGHSTIVGPWGNIVATTEHDEAIIYADIGNEIMEIYSLLRFDESR